jgi:hypothetical protein
MIMSNGVGLIPSMYVPGSYSINISTVRRVTSFFQASALVLLEEAAGICRKLEIPIAGVITDGQHSIRNAVARALPGVPHQLCHFHSLREAATPIFDADRHAKKELKKHVRGVRPLERALEGRTDEEAEAVRGYCLAVRSALTDDGQPPLDAAGLRLQGRRQAIDDSLGRVAEKRSFPTN